MFSIVECLGSQSVEFDLFYKSLFLNVDFHDQYSLRWKLLTELVTNYHNSTTEKHKKTFDKLNTKKPNSIKIWYPENGNQPLNTILQNMKRALAKVLNFAIAPSKIRQR